MTKKEILHRLVVAKEFQEFLHRWMVDRELIRHQGSIDLEFSVVDGEFSIHYLSILMPNLYHQSVEKQNTSTAGRWRKFFSGQSMEKSYPTPIDGEFSIWHQSGDAPVDGEFAMYHQLMEISPLSMGNSPLSVVQFLHHVYMLLRLHAMELGSLLCSWRCFHERPGLKPRQDWGFPTQEARAQLRRIIQVPFNVSTKTRWEKVIQHVHLQVNLMNLPQTFRRLMNIRSSWNIGSWKLIDLYVYIYI